MKQTIVINYDAPDTKYELIIHGVYQKNEQLFVLSKLIKKRNPDDLVYGIPEDMRVSAEVTVEVERELPIQNTVLLNDQELQQAFNSFQSCKCLFSQTVADEETELARKREAALGCRAELEAFFAKARGEHLSVEKAQRQGSEQSDAAQKQAAEQKSIIDHRWQTFKMGAGVFAGLAIAGLFIYKCASGDKESIEMAASMMKPGL